MKKIPANDRPVLFHLITAFGIGGAERLLERLLPRLSDYQHVIISLKGDGPIRKDFERAGLHTEVLNMRYPFSLSSFALFRRLVKRYKPQVLTTCLVHADLIGRVWAKCSGIPHVACYLVARYRDKRFWLVVRLMALTDWLVNDYIAVSTEVQRYFVEDVHLPKRKFTVIPNSVDPLVFQPNHNIHNRTKILRELDLPEDCNVVGTVSNLRQEKCIERLVAALPFVFQKDDKAHCIIVGDGVRREALEQQARALGISDRIRFVRFWPILTDIFPVLDIYVLPSAFEGMSIALLEAMSTGCGIVVTDTPENQEVIVKGTGLLVDTANSNILGDAILRLLINSDERQSLGKAARERVKKNFSLSQSVSELTDFYRKIIAES